ncbi:hypothetical protein AB0L06_30520 [Spirillospora sp. NPDC052269]
MLAKLILTTAASSALVAGLAGAPAFAAGPQPANRPGHHATTSHRQIQKSRHVVAPGHATRQGRAVEVSQPCGYYSRWCYGGGYYGHHRYYPYYHHYYPYYHRYYGGYYGHHYYGGGYYGNYGHYGHMYGHRYSR